MAKNVTIARLNTLVTANAVQFTKELDKAAVYAKSKGASINSALSAIGVGISIGGVMAFGKSVLDLGGQITDLASIANISKGGLQAISASAMQNGVTMEEVAKASEKMRQGLQDAKANGADPLNKSLRKLGLSATGMSALSMEEKWQVVAQRLSTAKDQQQAMNIASELFGTKIGPKLRTTLKEIAEAGGVDGLAQKMGGMILSDSQVTLLDSVGDKMDRLILKSKVFAASFFEPLLDPGSRSKFQDLWDIVSGPQKRLKNDIQNREPNGFILPGSKLGTSEDPVVKKMREAQAKEYADGDRKYREEMARIAERKASRAAARAADPFYQLKLKKDKRSRVDDLMELTMGDSGTLGGLLRDVRQKPQDMTLNTPSDSYSRIGLSTGAQVPPEQKKQTAHLKEIEDTLKKIRALLARPGLAAFAN